MDAHESRDFDGMRERRREAARMFAKGETQATVARRLEVSRQTSKRWHDALRAGGMKAMEGARRAGRRPKLLPAQLKAVEKALLKGPTAHGYSTELWTLERIGDVIEKITGVRYHAGHVWRVLRQLGWSSQKPTTRARERDERAVKQWMKVTWPELKKTPEPGAQRSSSSTKAASPSAPRSAAPGRRKLARPS
jgi:transposase